MNKSKINSAIILLLLLINIFLAVNLMVTRLTSGNISKEARESFVKVLNDRNISADISLVPEKYETRSEVRVHFYSIDDLRNIFLNKDVEYVSDGQSIIASAGDKRLTVNGRHFEYSTLHEAVPKNENKLIKALKKQGLSAKGCFLDPADGLLKVKIGDALIENVYLDIQLDKNGDIAYAAGVWPKVTLGDTKESCSVISAIGDIIKKIPEGSVIESISPVYSMDPREENAILTPAWRVSVNNLVYTVKE